MPADFDQRPSVSMKTLPPSISPRAPENPSKREDAIGEPSGPKGLVISMGTNVKYARVQEHGWPPKKIIGRPYIYPAFFMYEGETVKGLAKIMGKDEKL